MASGVSPWVYPVWNSLGFLNLVGYFLPHFREVFNYCFLKYIFLAFLFVFFLDSYDTNVGAFNIVPEVSEVVLISFDSFVLSASFKFTILSSISFILSSASFILLLVQSRVLLISVIALFIIDLLFYFFQVLVKHFLHLLSLLSLVYLSVTPFCFQDFVSSLLSLF